MPLLLLPTILIMTACSLLPPDNQDIAAKKQTIETYNGPTAEALFAGGCFWCTEADVEKLDGVITVISGFSGGDEADPTYDQVASGNTGHRESVLVTYDPSILSYRELVDYFWTIFDPTDPDGQFADRGYQYSGAIFYTSMEEMQIAEESKAALQASGRFSKPIITPILPAMNFYPAEEYHQDYYSKNPIRYRFYRRGSGRDRFLEEVWD